MKKCIDCKNEYPETLSYFYKHSATKDKLHPICKKCMSVRSKNQYTKNYIKKITRFNFPYKYI